MSFNTDIFWQLYDQFVETDFRDQQLNSRISQIVRENIEEIFQLKREEKGWQIIRAWIAIRDQQLFSREGKLACSIRCGDVIVVEYHWDRDVVITHVPMPEMVCGPLLGWEQSHGLFLPLFDKIVIEKAIRLRLDEDVKDAIARFEEEKKFWH